MKEKHVRSSKKKKAGAAVGTLALAGILALALGSGSFGLGFGGGNGVGLGSGDAASSPDAAFAPSSVSSVSASFVPSSMSAPGDASEEAQISVIRIEGNEIFFDDAPCADENALRDLILPLGAERTYEFYYDNAIKGTYDKVRTVLTELSEALDLTILEP